MEQTTYETSDRDLFVYLGAEIDHHQVSFITKEIGFYIGSKLTKNIIFDFENVRFMDSSGIGMVMDAYKRAVMLGGTVMVCNMSKKVDRIFRMSGVYRFVRALEI